MQRLRKAPARSVKRVVQIVQAAGVDYTFEIPGAKVAVTRLLKHGDFGLGSFNYLDDEMVVLDGICYHLHTDGSVSTATGNEKTLFAAITRFHAQFHLSITKAITLRELIALIDGASGGENVPLAMRISGTFSEVRTRTEPEQHRPDRSPAAATERIDTLIDTIGTVAGFRTPPSEGAHSVAGYHLHYVDYQRQRGGHVLDLTLLTAHVALSPITELHLTRNDVLEPSTTHLNLEIPAQQGPRARLSASGNGVRFRWSGWQR